MSVRLGLGFGAFPFSDTAAFWNWIDYCEGTAVDSVWLSERLVGHQANLEPLTALAAIAGRTRRLKFGMNATVLPFRDPLVLAKECATIDYLSDGRLLPMFGVGNDNAPEFAATGLDRHARGARSNEMLRLLNRLWTEDDIDFEGKYYHYQNVTISPKPRQSPLPVWIGGNSDAAIERTARYGTGWLSGSASSPAQVSKAILAIKQRAAELDRSIDDDHFGVGIPFRFGDWEEPEVQRSLRQLAARLPEGADPRAHMAVGGPEDIVELVKVMRACGASKFVMRPMANSDADMLAQSRRLAEEVIPEAHALV